MAISDNYMIQYLLQATRSGASPLQWQETEENGYVAHLNGVRIEFENIHTRTGSRICVTFSYATNQCVTRSVQLVEPVKSGFFPPAYKGDDDQRLADQLSELSLAIRRQAYERQRSDAESESAIREALYKRVLGSHNSELEP